MNSRNLAFNFLNAVTTRPTAVAIGPNFSFNSLTLSQKLPFEILSSLVNQSQFLHQVQTL